MIIRENETLEDLQLKGLRLIQEKNGFRFGLEAVLLADFARIGPRDTVADLGTGSGILPLLLRGREKGREYFAFEMQPEMAELAERNAALNGMADCFHVYREDVAALKSGRLKVDAAVSNPPWEAPGTGPVNAGSGAAAARHQQRDTLDAFLQAAYAVIRPRGRLFLVYPASGILELFLALRSHRLEPKRYRLVYHSPEHPARLLLTEAVRDGKSGLNPMPPFLMHTSDGSLTKELKSVYHMEEQTEVPFSSEDAHE